MPINYCHDDVLTEKKSYPLIVVLPYKYALYIRKYKIYIHPHPPCYYIRWRAEPVAEQ